MDRVMPPNLRDGECCDHCQHFDPEPYESDGYCQKYRLVVDRDQKCDDLELETKKCQPSASCSI